MKAKKQRDDTIDAFRGIAILSVMAFHYTVRWAPPRNPENLYGYAHAQPAIFALGYLGVHVFFVISGLVITMTVLRSRSTPDFISKRAARLYPAFVAAAFITLLAGLALPWPQAFRIDPLTFVRNLALPLLPLQHAYVDGVYWSLAVEIKFYAIVAVAFMLLRRKFWIAIAAVASAETLACLLGLRHAADLMLAPYTPFFLIGMSAWMWTRERERLAGVVLAVSALPLCILYCNGWREGAAQFWPAMIYLVIMIGALLVLFVSGRQPFPRLLARLGRVSYSLYLIHQFIGVAVIAILVRAGFGEMLSPIAAASICIGIAWLMWRYIEEPASRTIRHLSERLGRTPVTASTQLDGVIPG